MCLGVNRREVMCFLAVPHQKLGDLSAFPARPFGRCRRRMPQEGITLYY